MFDGANQRTFKADTGRRNFLARARPQFWLFAGACLFLLALIVWFTGKALFGGGYRPLDVPDLSTATASPTATFAAPAATPTENGALPWTAEMTAITSGPNAGSYQLPDNVAATLRVNWNEIVVRFLSRPVNLYTDELSAQYTIYDRLSPTATPVQGRPLPTPSSFYRANVPGRQNPVVQGCDRLGASCTLTDVWDDISVARYSPKGDLLGLDPAPGWRILYKATLVWKTDRWRLKQSTSQVVQLTPTPAPTAIKKK